MKKCEDMVKRNLMVGMKTKCLIEMRKQVGWKQLRSVGLYLMKPHLTTILYSLHSATVALSTLLKFVDES